MLSMLPGLPIMIFPFGYLVVYNNAHVFSPVYMLRIRP